MTEPFWNKWVKPRKPPPEPGQPTGESYKVDLTSIMAIPNNNGQRDRFLAGLPHAIAESDRMMKAAPQPVQSSVTGKVEVVWEDNDGAIGVEMQVLDEKGKRLFGDKTKED